jgi:hypothetical protein
MEKKHKAYVLQYEQPRLPKDRHQQQQPINTAAKFSVFLGSD